MVPLPYASEIGGRWAIMRDSRFVTVLARTQSVHVSSLQSENVYIGPQTASDTI